jgi:RNA polymerase sigma-70 factor (ECF subfamily)
MLVHSTRRDEALYREHASSLTAFATSLVGPDAAADAVSAAVLSVFGSPSWPTVDKPKSYLFRAVYNECVRTAKRDQDRRDRERQLPAPRDVVLPELRPEVADAVRELSTQQRAVIVLTYWLDLTVGDVADHLGISDGSVRKHLARARENLRRALGDD